MKNAKNIGMAALPVILGVLAAGVIMRQFRDIELIAQASDGFGG